MSPARIVMILLVNALLLGWLATRTDAALSWVAVGIPIGAAIMIVTFEIHDRRHHV